MFPKRPPASPRPSPFPALRFTHCALRISPLSLPSFLLSCRSPPCAASPLFLFPGFLGSGFTLSVRIRVIRAIRGSRQIVRWAMPTLHGFGTKPPSLGGLGLKQGGVSGSRWLTTRGLVGTRPRVLKPQNLRVWGKIIGGRRLGGRRTRNPWRGPRHRLLVSGSRMAKRPDAAE